ncbi:MAG: lysoplasmalogenase family protein [Candidatus Saccharibacteria bacterium]|nr:lysoplasmalogenase family protein [Candidatus Saccharibacteria bacterium]
MTTKEPKTIFGQFIEYARSVDKVWLKTWIIIYVGFLILDAYTHIRYGNGTVTREINLFGDTYAIELISNGTFIGTTILKFAGIILNVVYAFVKFPKDHLLQIALALTLLADTLLVLNNTSPIGVLVFCFAQYFHTSRFMGSSPKFFIPWSILLLTLLFMGWIYQIDSIFVVGFVYAASLIVNLILVRKWYNATRKEKKSSEIAKRASFCAFYGFVLFVCCDSCVGVSFFSLIGVLPAFLYGFANYFSWLFYYVSQVLISNSSVLVRDQKKSQIIKNSLGESIQP